MIRMEQIEDLNQKLLDEKVLSDHVQSFKADEPYVYSWMTTHAKAILALMAKKGVSDSTVMTEVFENICRSYMFTHSLLSRNRELLVDEILERDHFQLFLDGKLGDAHYQYSTDGLAPDSDLVKAKDAHRRMALQDLRKRLVPLIAEDVGMGLTRQETLKKVESIGKA